MIFSFYKKKSKTLKKKSTLSLEIFYSPFELEYA